MVYQPPSCPNCPAHPALWKDTTQAAPGREDQWNWFCAGCRGRWRPTSEQKQRFTHGTSRGQVNPVR